VQIDVNIIHIIESS